MILLCGGSRGTRNGEFLLAVPPFRVVLGGRGRRQWPASPRETDAIQWLDLRTPADGTRRRANLALLGEWQFTG